MYHRLSYGDFGGDSIVVADSAYPPNYFICKPLETVNTAGEQNYQYCQIKTRNVVERVNGQLKRRFAILLTTRFEWNHLEISCETHFMLIDYNSKTLNLIRKHFITFHIRLGDKVTRTIHKQCIHSKLIE